MMTAAPALDGGQAHALADDPEVVGQAPLGAVLGGDLLLERVVPVLRTYSE